MQYIRQQSAWRVFANAFGIYVRYPVPLLTLYLIFVFPVEIIKMLALEYQLIIILIVFAFVQVIALMVLSYANAAMISDICIGLQPSVARACRRGFAYPGRTAKTILLTRAYVLLGFLCLIIPGVVLSCWYAFIGPVVVIEGLGSRAALRRSKELGRGFYLRNFGVIALTILAVMVLVFIVNVLIALALSKTAADPGLAIEGVQFVVQMIFGPPAAIVLILLYYDMRARKEGYGAEQLTEELTV